MADSTLWWLAAGGLIALELVTGTFYLLMISLGLMAAAMAAHAGFPMSLQWVGASLVGGGSVLAWRAFKRSRPAPLDAQKNHDVNMDIGETVQVDHWQDDHTCSVKYRGTQWQASLHKNEMPEPGVYVIAEVIGSRLILKKSHSF